MTCCPQSIAPYIHRPPRGTLVAYAPPPSLLPTSLPPPPPSFFSGVHRSPPITHTCHLASLYPLKTLNAFLLDTRSFSCPSLLLIFLPSFLFLPFLLRKFLRTSTTRETFLLPHFIPFEMVTFIRIDLSMLVNGEEDCFCTIIKIIR